MLYINKSTKVNVDGVEVHPVRDNPPDEIVFIYFEVGGRKLYLQKDADYKNMWGEFWNARMFTGLDAARNKAEELRQEGLPVRLRVYSISCVEPTIEP